MRQIDSEVPTIVILGATGATGRHVVTTALAAGHRVRALVRRRGVLEPDELLTEVDWPAIDDPRPIHEALAGADAVISALGGASRGPTTVCTRAIRSTVRAMQATGVRRLVVVSAHGTADSRDHSLYAKAVWAGVPDRMRDKESMERAVTGSALDWTVVRPPRLSNAPANGGYVVGPDLPIRLWSAIGRADLAQFLVDEAVAGNHIGRFATIRR